FSLSPCRKPTAASCRRASADVQTRVLPSNHSSRHAGIAPAIRRRSTGQPQDTSNDLGTFTVLNTLHRAHAHLFQRLMIQLSRVVFSHAGTESIPVHAVKQNIELLMNGLIVRTIRSSWAKACFVSSTMRSCRPLARYDSRPTFQTRLIGCGRASSSTRGYSSIRGITA